MKEEEKKFGIIHRINNVWIVLSIVNSFTFISVKFHFPQIRPNIKCIQIILKNISFTGWRIQLCIISQKNCGAFLSILVLLIWGMCNLKCSQRTVIFLPVYKISSLKIILLKLYSWKLWISCSRRSQWMRMRSGKWLKIRCCSLWSSGFSVSLLHFYLKKISTRGVLFCISSVFLLHRSLYLLLAYCLYWR